MERQSTTHRLTLTGIMIALGTALSFIEIWHMPLGGSVTLLSMVPIICLTVFYGTKWGFCSCFIYSLIQLAIGLVKNGILGWGLTTASLIGTVFLDYILAYTIICVSGVFRKKGTTGVILGVALAVTLRFICHFVSGAIIFDIWCEWDNVWYYSLCYNGAFMLPEMILTVVGTAALFKTSQIKKLFGY